MKLMCTVGELDLRRATWLHGDCVAGRPRFWYRKRAGFTATNKKSTGMATAFITGATGFIGSHVALHLLQKGWRVRALKRPGSPAPNLEKATIEWCPGDIRYLEQLRSAMAGCESVFHVAADYRLWARNPEEIYETNVTGTINVLQAALLNRVDRVVYTSSVGALGLRTDGKPANEATPSACGARAWPKRRRRNSRSRSASACSRSGGAWTVRTPSRKRPTDSGRPAHARTST